MVSAKKEKRSAATNDERNSDEMDENPNKLILAKAAEVASSYMDFKKEVTLLRCKYDQTVLSKANLDSSLVASKSLIGTLKKPYEYLEAVAQQTSKMLEECEKYAKFEEKLTFYIKKLSELTDKLNVLKKKNADDFEEYVQLQYEFNKIENE